MPFTLTTASEHVTYAVASAKRSNLDCIRALLFCLCVLVFLFPKHLPPHCFLAGKALTCSPSIKKRLFVSRTVLFSFRMVRSKGRREKGRCLRRQARQHSVFGERGGEFLHLGGNRATLQ